MVRRHAEVGKYAVYFAVNAVEPHVVGQIAEISVHRSENRSGGGAVDGVAVAVDGVEMAAGTLPAVAVSFSLQNGGDGAAVAAASEGGVDIDSARMDVQGGY